MSESFKVGTICIGQNFKEHATFRNGMECEIVNGLQLKESRNIHTGRINTKPRYQVRWVDGTVLWYSPIHLRRKPPKQSDSQWADEAIRKLKKQSSDHVAVQLADVIPEEAL